MEKLLSLQTLTLDSTNDNEYDSSCTSCGSGSCNCTLYTTSPED